MCADDEGLFANILHDFLDREGVLSQQPPEGSYVTRWEEFHILPGVETAVARLNHSGRKVIVVTNQRGIALGLMTQSDLAIIHSNLRAHLEQRGAHLFERVVQFCNKVTAE